MCGISGFSGRFSRELLEAMSASIAYRGPDNSDTLFIDGKCGRTGLAHRRLSIIDLSKEGQQPMGVVCERCGVGVSSSSQECLWLICNGEIYNYWELRSELRSKGHRFHSQSDSEILLHLYAEEGVEMLTKLNGIFAFALYDGRPTGQFDGVRPGDLLLARDGVGVKPLYYAVNESGFLFASELKALLQESSIDRSLDFEAMQYYLTYQWCPAPRTPIKSIKKLEPGHALIIRNGNIRRHWQFYDLPYDQPIESLSRDEAVQEVQDYVRKAVRRQMVADVPVGAFLSGGLDSSAVVAFAREVAPERRLQCFTIGFSSKDLSALDGMTEDLPYARRVAKHLGVDLQVVQAGPDMIDDVERMIYHLDEPQGDPAPINALLISQLAREHGIKVLLSGAGGDDIFTGYRRHFALLQERYWDWLPQVLRKKIGGAAQHIHVDNPVGRRFSKAFQYAGLNGDRRIASYFFWINPEQLLPLYGPIMRE
ncbi:MAG: asparagine synthase (glutamine-hydrolyzing), partial [Nitrospina sp.]|nr:asparagine synthase (glutamine-hydrolyzing) [Nitrospina sp.]